MENLSKLWDDFIISSMQSPTQKTAEHTNLQRLEDFLVTIDLKRYREMYLPIKIVEMNMPKNTQALFLLYKIYWEEKRFISFEEFYAEYERYHHAHLKVFHKKTQMCEVCFPKGLRARIYRTWASIITQIHAGYTAESVFGMGTVKMSEDLDRKGADIQVHYKGVILNYDVKKEARSGVMGRSTAPKEPIPGIPISIRYVVPDLKTILHPQKKNGTGFLKAYAGFKERFLDTNLLRVLPNGFVVFTPKIFEKRKKEIDSR